MIAISYSEYTLTPSPGIIFVDSLIVFQRDVTLRLPDYQLKVSLQDRVIDHHRRLQNTFWVKRRMMFTIPRFDLYLREMHNKEDF